MATLISKVLISGTFAAAATTLAASLAGRRATGSSAAPLNATSHFLWGERAGRKDAYSLKFTATGFIANLGASIFWALFYEGLAGRRRRTPARALADGALISGAAYVTDYHVVPKRLTPGFELRLPARALAGIYAALALGLCARDVLWSPTPRLTAGSRPRRSMRRYAGTRAPREVIKQARSDLEHGLEDTDCRGVAPLASHCPQPSEAAGETAREARPSPAPAPAGGASEDSSRPG